MLRKEVKRVVKLWIILIMAREASSRSEAAVNRAAFDWQPCKGGFLVIFAAAADTGHETTGACSIKELFLTNWRGMLLVCLAFCMK